MEPPPLPDKPLVGQILHIDQEDALRLTGSLMNEFTREIIQVFILKFKIGQVSTSGSTPLNRKIGHPLRKTTNPLKKQGNCFKKLRIRRSSLFVFTNQNPAKGNHLLLFLMSQVTEDQANCCIYSLFAELQNVPVDYSPVYFRRWMAHHFCSKIQALWVNTTIGHYFPNLLLTETDK